MGIIQRYGLMPKAVVAGEDSLIYNHRGYDEEQLEIAIREVLAKKEKCSWRFNHQAQGLVKNLFLSSRAKFCLKTGGVVRHLVNWNVV